MDWEHGQLFPSYLSTQQYVPSTPLRSFCPMLGRIVGTTAQQARTVAQSQYADKAEGGFLDTSMSRGGPTTRCGSKAHNLSPSRFPCQIYIEAPQDVLDDSTRELHHNNPATPGFECRCSALYFAKQLRNTVTATSVAKAPAATSTWGGLNPKP